MSVTSQAAPDLFLHKGSSFSVCQRREVVNEVGQGDRKAQHLLSGSDRRIELTMIQEVEPKVLLPMYTGYIHI
jgi:hypothetical protein